MFMWKLRYKIWEQWYYFTRLVGRARHRVWWRIQGRSSCVVKWPTGWTEPDHLGNQFLSSDPNDHYRAWLEANIGRQGWDWDWRPHEGGVKIWYRPSQADRMVEAVLKWS